MIFIRNSLTGEMECYSDAGVFDGIIVENIHDNRLDAMAIEPLIEDIYELLSPFPGVASWIGSEYRENKMGKLSGITYVYTGCKPFSDECCGDYFSCPSICSSGDPNTVRLFADRGWDNTSWFPGFGEGENPSELYPGLYKRRSREEFIGILSRCFLARGYHGPVWTKIRRDQWKQWRAKL